MASEIHNSIQNIWLFNESSNKYNYWTKYEIYLNLFKNPKNLQYFIKPHLIV